MTKTLDDYLKVAEKIPKTGLFNRDGSALTDPEAMANAQKIMEGEEFQGKLAFNQRLKAAGGLRNVDDVEQFTKEQFNAMIELQQDQLDLQMENIVKEEKYREMGFAGKIAKKWDQIKGLPKTTRKILTRRHKTSIFVIERNVLVCHIRTIDNESNEMGIQIHPKYDTRPTSKMD